MRLLWLPPRVAFFLTSETHVVISSVLSFRHHSLSLCRRPLLFRQQHSFSLSLLRRSLARSVCSDVPAGLSHSPSSAARVLRLTLNFSPQKASAVGGRQAARARRRKGPERTSTTLSSTLSLQPRRRLVESPHQRTVEINWPLLLKFFSCLFVWWIMLIWCMECRWCLLFGLGCTDNPKNIGRIS
jgi:hypothetical protein